MLHRKCQICKDLIMMILMWDLGDDCPKSIRLVYAGLPGEIDFAAVQPPFCWPGICGPIQGFAGWLVPGCHGEAGLYIGFLLGAGRLGLSRDEQWGPAFREELQPLFVLFPWDLCCQSHAIAVDGIEGFVLRKAEAHGVDAHL